MRILHVITTINLGGAENHLYDLIVGQRHLGYQVCVVYLKGDSYWKQKYQELGVETVCLNIISYALLYRFYLLKKVIARFNADAVHAHMPPAELVARLALIGNNRTKFILSKHNDEPFAPYFKNRFLANWVAVRASAIICISKAVQSYIEGWLPSSQYSKLKLVYYCVDNEKFSCAIKSSDLIFSEAFVVGTVARLTKQKSLHTLLHAFERVLEQQPNARLIIVGVGELKESLESLSKQLKISHVVHWLGKRSDIPSVMKCFDVFALTSIYEGFGLVLLEALAAEVPIVASRVSAIPEVLDEGRCGLLFESQNSEDLAEQILKLRDQELRKKLICNGSHRIESFFTREKMVLATDAIYKICLLI